ncbi:MAG: LysR family transcriptional regulator [Alphaproteobacteria bacterium]|nr:LysR family transcriptional regulator [Alphaproteobacteria bacterium]MBV8408010.1 LysR family transcriptional regulator [Alphaproteobacteria bacterium]
MDLNALVVFAKVVEANSFSEAARRLKMPISTVSRRVAELEDQLGVRLLERSTRNLRLTELGTEVLEQAIRSAELSEAVESIVSNRLTSVVGTLRLSAPPSISDTLLAPLVTAFQASYPNVRIQILVTERHVDHIAEGVDLVFRRRGFKDSSLVVRKLLSYRHQLVASPEYLASCKAPRRPHDLLDHRLLTFSYWRPESSWSLVHANGVDQESVTFEPSLAMNDFAGLVPALLAGAGIGELPPVVQPDLVRQGRLVEVMPDWHLPTLEFSLVHLGNRHISKPCRLFKEFATQMVPKLFPDLPT